ncbi:MAG: CHAT domain-containing protein [candidate division Zixibacteria bacterium]
MPSLKYTKASKSFTGYLNKHYQGSVEIFFGKLGAEADNLIRTDLNKSEQFINKLNSMDNLLPDKYKAHLYRIRGRHYHLSGKYNDAYKWYIRAENSFTELRDFLNRAKIQKALLDVLIYRGKKEEALQMGRRALYYFKRSDLTDDYAQVMTNIGNLYHRIDENKTALRYYDKALKVFTRRKNKYAIALVQFNQANVLVNLNRINQAESLYRNSAKIYESINLSLFACQAEYSLAYISYLKGEYSHSLKEFSEVANKFASLGDKRCVALAELDCTEINLHLNLYGQVIEDASDIAKDFENLNMSYEQAKSIYFSAEAYFAHGDFERVNQLLIKATKLFEHSNVHWRMACRFLKARLNICENRPEAAIKSLQHISRYYKTSGNIRKYIDVRLALLDGLISQNKAGQAIRLYNILLKSTSGMAGYQKYIYYTLAGDLYSKRQDINRATKLYRRAIKVAEKSQLSIFPYEMRRFYWIDKLSTYEKLVSIYLAEKKYKQAFDILNRGKAILFDKNDSFDIKRQKTKSSSELWDEYKSLKASLRKALMPVGTESSERILNNNKKIHGVERKIWKINRSLPDTNKIYPDKSIPVDLLSIQDRLSDGEVLIQYAIRNQHPGAFVISNYSSDFISLASEMNGVRKLTRNFYFIVVKSIYDALDNQITKNILSEISEIIWNKIESKMPNAKKLFIIPDGFVNRIPFYALSCDDGSLIAEKYSTRILPSASFLSKGGKNKVFPKNIDVFAVTGDNLPGIESEKNIIRKHFPKARIYAGQNANSDQLRNSMRETNGLVHIAAHARQSYENELFSQILLDDGPLYTFDIYSCQINSRLIILSGCQTGDPGLFYKGNTTSLAQSFLFSGAKAVMASYWPISDDITGVFMDFLYRHLTSGMNCGEALRGAIFEMKSLTDDTRHWASFYLLGPG